MCKPKDEKRDPRAPTDRPPAGWLGTPFEPRFPERRPLRRSGGLWGGEGDERRDD